MTIEYISQFILMAVLLVLSAFMSGSETALFSLSRRQVQSFSKSGSNLQKLVSRLLEDPRRLLTSILFGNMAVNVLYFALSSVLSVDMAKDYGSGTAAGQSLASFVLLVLFGEMLPKSFAYSHSIRFSMTAAPVCYVFTRIFSPLLWFFEFFIVCSLKQA